jgi:hypothetical protein
MTYAEITAEEARIFIAGPGIFPASGDPNN